MSHELSSDLTEVKTFYEHLYEKKTMSKSRLKSIIALPWLVEMTKKTVQFQPWMLQT